MCHGQYKAKDNVHYKERHKDAVPYVRKSKHKNDYSKEYQS